MGFILNVDLETSAGPTQEAYIRIDNYRFNKDTSEVIVTTTCWLDPKKAHSFNRTSIEEPLGNAVGLIGSKALFYSDEDSEGTEIEIPNLFKGHVVEEQTVSTPIFENKKITKKVPYISFDEMGEEITLEREITEVKEVQVGNTLNVKKVINPELLGNLYEFSYGLVKKKLAEIFPEDKIEIY